MKTMKIPCLVPAAVIGFVLAGCAFAGDASGGTGGTGATGGAGGGRDIATLRVAHLAPELPTVDDTRVDVVIVDEGSFLDLEFGDVTAYVELQPGIQVVEFVPPGATDEPLATVAPRLEPGGVYTVVAYRDSSAESLMSLFVFEAAAGGLTGDSGQVAIGHGVDDLSWQVVNVVNADTETVIVADFTFGAQTDPAEFPAGELNFGFDVLPPSPMIDEGPFRADVPAGEFSILIAVDNDTTDESVSASVYAIGAMTEGPISQLPSSTP